MTPGSRWRTAFAVCRLLPWFLALGALKRLVSVPTLARWSWRQPRGHRADDPHLVASIASCVLRTGTIAGVPDRDCLQRSLLLYRELSAAGLRPELAVGFQRVNGTLSGHAWVTVAGVVVAEPELDESSFEPMMRFGESGAPIPAARVVSAPSR